MRVRVLQHVAHEGPGAIADWAAARAHGLSVTRFDLGEPAPGIEAFDMLVVMGGPMSANDDAAHAWMPAEKRLIGAAIREGRPLLGVCLGAQLIASVLGSRVYAAREPEIGWFPVRTLPAAGESRTFAGVPAEFTPLHWHGETFDLPARAVRLAETDVCANQAFEIAPDGGRRAGGAREGAPVLGLQFHLEATEATVRAMLDADGASLACVPGTTRPESLLADPSRWHVLRPLLDDVLDRLAKAAPSARRSP